MSEENCPKCEEGLPAWMGTFADLMSLLMCFFVLLLSMATMDANRFKKMAESLNDAFGVQREVIAYEIVKGTSVVAQHFSPAAGEPTIIDEVRQQTTDSER
ncbi:MAG: flagellar motor protein MotB, partial [Cycloclasticus sp.]